MASTAESLEQADRFQQAGDTAGAVTVYRDLAQREPGNAKVWSLLGTALVAMGRWQDASESLRESLRFDPDNAATLDQLGIALAQLGRLEDAVPSFRHALRICPESSAIHDNLGTALSQLGQLEEAAASFRSARQLEPGNAETHFKLGIVLEKLARHAEAVESFRESLRCQPNRADVYRNLALALAELDRFDEAVATLNQALKVRPNYVEGLNALGIVRQKQGSLDEAASAFQRAIELRPDYALAFGNLRNVYRRQGKLDEAAAHCRRVIARHPASAVAHNSLGTVLLLQDQLGEAEVAFQQAIRLKPNYGSALGNLGHVYRNQGFLDKALDGYRQAIAVDPKDSYAHSNFLYALHFHPNVNTGWLAVENARWRAQHADPLKKSIRSHRNPADSNRRLKIGYVSPNFYLQAECFFVIPLLERHDREHFEIHCYASVTRPDAMTQRTRRAADAWHDVVRLSNESLAEKIRADGIDILVDLTMHMGNRRMTLFARKPSPVQVTWLAYPGSTGLDTIDYRLTDAYMEPLGNDHSWSAEDPVRLPDCWCVYDPLGETPAPNEPPSVLHGYVTFGSLNGSLKHNEALLKLWAQVLGAVPDSRLVLLSGEGLHRNTVRAIFEAAGISPDRVNFVRPGPRYDYLQQYHQIDICLDPLPYNGITTTCDAFLMGVPVLSMIGKTPAGRAGLSLLSNIGLPELVAHTEQEFIRLAQELAANPTSLKSYRSTLRQRMQASPLMDASRFARQVEAAYRTMWQGWCKNQGLTRDSRSGDGLGQSGEVQTVIREDGR